MITITVFNLKGGCGKTTTVINLAAALTSMRKRVMVIDLDGQSNLTESMGLTKAEPRTVYGAIRGEYPLPVVPTRSGVDIVPSCLDLSAAESELLHEPGREMILKGLVAKAVDERCYDYILIDCPPMLGLLTLNALTVADYLIIPVQVEYLAMRGMAKILQSVQVVQERLNAKLKVGGILLTMYDRRKTLHKSVADVIRESFDSQVFHTVIRSNVALAEAPAHCQSVLDYNPRSYGAEDYLSLAQEVLSLN
jgi:chromosome partitioning protein